ncbi:MAG: DNA polymerase I, partial [Thermoanaerobaculia bacterium]
MPAQRQRLFLIDGHSDIFRAFYAIPHLSNSKGLPTNAVYGFLNMLRKILREEEPELVGVALDVSADTVRREKFEDYKANRAPMPEELAQQIPWIRRTLEAHHIPILEMERYEADDVLGTLAKKAAAAGYEVVLVSADKDLMQLVDEHVSLYHTRREKLYDPKGVEEDFGVPPAQVVDVLALKGDSVDNVPGVPGIGDKGACQLIRQFGSLEELLERAEEVPRKSYREGLLQHRDQAELSKELVTIYTDLPLEFDPQSLEHAPPDREALQELYRELEFFSLLEELEGAAGGPVGLVAAEELESPEEWRARVAGLPRRLFVAPIGEGELLGLAVGGESGPVLYADFRRPGLRQAAVESLAEWLASGDRELVGHDTKEVLRFSEAGAEAKPELIDTLLISHLLRSALRAQSLEEVVLETLNHKALSPKEVGWDKGSEPALGAEPLLAFAGERVELLRQMARQLRRELGDGRLLSVYREIEAPLVSVLLAMEERGIELDVDFLSSMSKELADHLAALEDEIYELAGDRFNINSPRQLGEVMFERLGYPVIKKTRKTKSYSTDSATLEELALRGYPLPDRVLGYRELAKLKSTYVDALPALVGADGRLHTRYNQVGAVTGRISSNNPNLQNIPVRTEQGREIRRAFRAPKGRRLLVADYNQIELRTLAHIAGEEALIEAFQAGKDIHAATAASVFGVDEKLLTPDQRRAAKTINFGILYG